MHAQKVRLQSLPISWSPRSKTSPSCTTTVSPPTQTGRCAASSASTPAMPSAVIALRISPCTSPTVRAERKASAASVNRHVACPHYTCYLAQTGVNLERQTKAQNKEKHQCNNRRSWLTWTGQVLTGYDFSVRLQERWWVVLSLQIFCRLLAHSLPLTGIRQALGPGLQHPLPSAPQSVAASPLPSASAPGLPIA